MCGRRSMALGLVLAMAAGCSPSEPKPKAAALPWEDALAKGSAGGSSSSPKKVGRLTPPKRDAAPATTPEGLRDQARGLAQAGNFAGALEAAEAGLHKDASSRETRYIAASAAQFRAFEVMKQGDRKQAERLFLRSAELIRGARKPGGEPLRPQELMLLRQAVYNEACSYALAGAPEKALASLNEAFLEHGAENYDNLDDDADLVSLRALPAFAELKEKVAAKKDAAHQTMLVAAREQAHQALAENKPFAFAFALSNLDDKPVSLDDFAGKVRIVDLWGTWCPPCKAEVPHFVALQKKYGDRGLQVIGINYERDNLSTEDTKKAIKDFAETVGINYPCVIGDDATRGKVPDFAAYPTTLFIDRAGKVRAKTIGYKPLETIEEIVTTLLAEEPAGGPGDAGKKP